jgi:hypothetical protein
VDDPASRIKAGEHRVPLCDRAIELLTELGSLHSGYVFSGQRPRQPLSNVAMLMQIKRMEREDLTVHGFRWSFRDWAAEKTNTPREICEMALAHRIGNKAEAAYRRGDLFERRRALMAKWQRYCGHRSAPRSSRSRDLSLNGSRDRLCTAPPVTRKRRFYARSVPSERSRPDQRIKKRKYPNAWAAPYDKSIPGDAYHALVAA